jgi:hypothetical protein
MPSSKNYVRDYKQEYKSQHASPKAKKERAQRNQARAIMEKAGKVRKGDGKDVAHKNNNTSNNSKSNLSVQSKAKNRSFNRDKNAGRK